MMISKNKIIQFAIFLLALSSIAFIGCGGGGDAAPPRPSVEVLPADYDFGIVTDSNSVQPLEVTIKNNGTAGLSLTSIILSDTTNFSLDLNKGTNPCGSTAPTIGIGSSCNVMVNFLPLATDTFSGDLTIESNDPVTPRYDLSLFGSKQVILETNVKINQIKACPRANTIVYVSVTDQAGFPITGLTQSDFTLAENAGVPSNPSTAGFVNNSVSLSVSLLLDYSGSITDEPDNVTDMENAAIGFINDLGVNDEAEIIKFGTNVDVAQEFTSVQSDLIDAIQADTDLGRDTALYDAIVQASNDISSSTKDRRAIIVITDGVDMGAGGLPQSTNTISDVIANANAFGVPVFTVGLGNVDTSVLEQIADETGGIFSPSTTSDNLATIYQQLANLLFTNQYILTYNSGIVADGVTTADLTVTATYGSLTGEDTFIDGISACAP